MTDVKLYDLAASPNNMKIRIALRYKGIPFDAIVVDPEDRAEVVRVSGQPLTPVLSHGDRVIFDSAAILRYLDSNFRGSPSLFSSDYATMKSIEEWERFARGELLEPVGIVFRQFFSPEADRAELNRASRTLHECTERIEARLRESRWLVGDTMSAADVTAAPAIWYGMLPPEAVESNPIAAFFASSLRLGDARERTREWVRRVMAYNR